MYIRWIQPKWPAPKPIMLIHSGTSKSAHCAASYSSSDLSSAPDRTDRSQ